MDLQLRRHNKNSKLNQRATLAVVYHSIFNYPLTRKELLKWVVGSGIKVKKNIPQIKHENGYYYIGSKEVLFKRLLNKNSSKKKLVIARRAAKILGRVPSIKLVAITGSLAMNNAQEDSDIDLMIVTSEGVLWTTRVFSYILLKTLGYEIRKAGQKEEKDKLCLNIWLDESSLAWEKRNIFTAHEICQVIPIENKSKTYERFIQENSWIEKYWPETTKASKRSPKLSSNHNFWTKLFRLVEPFSFWFQYLHMRNKITKEVITPSKALFHPVDWSRLVNSKIKLT